MRGMKKIMAAISTAAMLVGMLSTTVMAAGTVPATPDAEAGIVISKTVTKETTADWPVALGNGFTFELTSVKALLNDETTMSAVDMPMPAANTTNNAGGTAKVHTASVTGFATGASTDTTQTKTATPTITYTKAGAYMYTLKEVIPTSQIPGVIYDTNTYTIVVYVVNVVDRDTGVPTGAVTVKNVTSWKNLANIDSIQWGDLTATDNGGTAANPDGDNAKVGVSSDADGDNDQTTLEYPFNNPYASADLTVTKTVTGDLGDKTKHFDFSVEITGLTATQTYAVTYKNTDGATMDTSVTHGATTITTAADGKATLSAKLKHGEEFTIVGLPSGAKYKVTETGSTGVTATYKVTDADSTIEEKTTGTTLGAGVATNEITVDGKDDTAAFTNNRVSPTITGVMMQYLPFIAVALLAIVGILIMLIARKRRHANVTGRY